MVLVGRPPRNAEWQDLTARRRSADRPTRRAPGRREFVGGPSGAVRSPPGGRFGVTVSLWMLIVLGTAGGGALLLWHMVSQTKQISEQMLDKYREMLDNARAEKTRQLAEQSAASAEPIETAAAGPAEARE